jgi:threonine dehydratase
LSFLINDVWKLVRGEWSPPGDAFFVHPAFCTELLEVVSLESIQEAIRSLLLTHKLLCEGAGAASVAAAIQLATINQHRKIACILSGGNLAVEQIHSFLER